MNLALNMKVIVWNRGRKRTEPETTISKLSRAKPNPNWTNSVRFEPVAVSSFEKSSYIFKPELSFLSDTS